MQRILLLVLCSLFSFPAVAGKITIEKSDSLIRNDLFDQKRERAEEYKQRETERKASNERWISEIDPHCGLWRDSYLIFLCADGRYYKGYQQGEQREYRELSTQEVKKLRREKD